MDFDGGPPPASEFDVLSPPARGSPRVARAALGSGEPHPPTQFRSHHCKARCSSMVARLRLGETSDNEELAGVGDKRLAWDPAGMRHEEAGW